MLLTHEEFVHELLPKIVAAWETRCFCSSPGFRKLLAFNFCDYHSHPMTLVDSELIGHHLVRSRFPRTQEVRHSAGEIFQEYQCPQCKTRCLESYNEYSISMYRSYYEFAGTVTRADVGLYLVGIRAFSKHDFDAVTDYREAASKQEYFQTLGATI